MLPASSPLLAPLRGYAGVRLVVGVSGGADSVALLRALLEVGARPTVAHMDHQLRPDSASDAAWVAQLCQELGVSGVQHSAPVARVAALRGWTQEDAARRLRYAFFARVGKAQGTSLILTAHTQDDQAETVLWQLLRGEAELSGIARARGALRRPWLGVSRSEIEAALRIWSQPWRQDSSNTDTRFTRNWLRHEVLPLLRSRFPALGSVLARVAQQQAEDNALLRDLSDLNSHVSRRHLPLALLRRAVRAELRDANLGFHADHLEHLAAALHEGRTQHLTLPGQHSISVLGGAYPRLHLSAAAPWPRPAFPYPATWTLRHPHAADRLRLSGGTRKVSDVLGEARVARTERAEVWLLADEHGAVRWLGLSPAVWSLGTRQALGASPAPLSLIDTDDQFMQQALGLAHQAAAAGEVPVGALLVRGDHVVASAANRSRELGDMTRHAELEVVRAACAVLGPYLSGCTLYVTLEPCPMCLGAMLEARVDRVVYAAANPRAGALGGVHDLLAHHWGAPLAVTPGVRAAEATRLLRQTFATFRAAPTPL